jgi:hypothetical protein
MVASRMPDNAVPAFLILYLGRIQEKIQDREKAKTLTQIESYRWDLNPQPIDYESIALPLSHGSRRTVIHYSVEYNFTLDY